MSPERGELEIDPDIRRASTLPGWFYSDPAWYERTRERVFARTWHFAGEAGEPGEAGGMAEPGQVRPWTLLAGCLDEPLLLARDGEALRCLSNVCTHRANLVVSEPAAGATGLRCRYHGRRFGLDGRFRSMPEFEGALEFPSPADDLPELPLARFGDLLFASLAPAFPFAELVAPVAARLHGLPLERLVLDPASRREYSIEASWALYCDNYLEG